MRSPAPTLALLILAPLAGGCLTLFPAEDGALRVEGPTRGYSPTASFLKVHVETEDGRRILVDFDRRDWHVSELARRLDGHRLNFLLVEGPPRLLGEVVVETVFEPEDIASLRYASMGASEEDRLRMDAEYDAILALLEDRLIEPGPPPTPEPEPVAIPQLPEEPASAGYTRPEDV